MNNIVSFLSWFWQCVLSVWSIPLLPLSDGRYITQGSFMFACVMVGLAFKVLSSLFSVSLGTISSNAETFSKFEKYQKSKNEDK